MSEISDLRKLSDEKLIKKLEECSDALFNLRFQKVNGPFTSTAKISETKKELSTIVAEMLAKKAQEKKITKVYFDRGIYKYHGRVKLFAETLRKKGMEF